MVTLGVYLSCCNLLNGLTHLLIRSILYGVTQMVEGIPLKNRVLSKIMERPWNSKMVLNVEFEITSNLYSFIT